MHSLVTDCPAGTATPSANIMELLQLSVADGVWSLASALQCVYLCVSHFLHVVQASPQYGQQHQVPFNLGGALPRASFGQYQGPVMGNQQSHLPGQGYSYPSAGSQANAHLFADSQQFRNHQQPAGSQAYGNNDLASQMLLQRLQQQSYSQAPQGGAGLDRFFNPLAFSNAQNARVPAIAVRAAEYQ